MASSNYVEINVSLNGRHFFATAPRSCDNWDTEKFNMLWATMTGKFPPREGYKITATSWSTTGTTMLEYP